MSIDPTSRFTNQVNPTQHTNNNGGGLGGGSASSYKNEQSEQSSLKEEPLVDEFTPSEGIEKETDDEVMDKTLWDMFIELLCSIYTSILNFIGIKKESSDLNEEPEKNIFEQQK